MIRLFSALPVVVWLLTAPGAALVADEQARIAGLVRRLAADTFAEREKAAKELDAIGPAALPALRTATTSADPEQRTRAEALVRRIESRVTAARLMAPKRVRLSFQDTPVVRAIADFKARTGYDIGLAENVRIADRPVNLETGEIPFWEAVERFCRAAGLTEERLPPEIGGGPGLRADWVLPYDRRRAPGYAARGRVALVDGKWSDIPTADTTAIRVRALGKAEIASKEGDGEEVFRLEVALEPRLRWLATDAAEVRTPAGDRGHSLGPVYPDPRGRTTHVVPLRLGLGPTPPTVLKELSGTLTVRVLDDPEPQMTVDQITQAGGKTVRAAGRLAVRVVDADQPTPGQFRVRFEVDAPEGARFSGSWHDGRLHLGFGPGPGADYEMVLVNDRGEVLTQGTWGMKMAGGAIQYTLGCPTAANPAKLICMARKVVTLDIPFTLRDVPLR